MKVQNSKLKTQNSNPLSLLYEFVTPPTPSYLKRECRRRGRYFKGGMGGFSGFTLIELVITMVLIGIVAYVVATAMATGFKAYFTTDFRKEALDQARIAMERMTREIRNVRSSSDIGTANATEFCFMDTNGTVISFRYPGLSANTIARQDGLANLAACPGGAGNTLSENITYFKLTNPDGSDIDLVTLTSTRRVVITLTSTISNESVQLRSEVYPRNL